MTFLQPPCSLPLLSGPSPARRRVVVAAAVLLAGWLPAGEVVAQGRPKAQVTPFVAADSVPAGATIRVAVTVTLPAGLHVQSDAPRDPSLIPTVLSVDAPAGLSVQSLVYPTPSDFAQEGQPQPLAVFDHEFVAGAVLQVPAGQTPGPLTIPGRLRYQACDDRVCFAPQTAQVTWTTRITPAGTPAGAPTHADVFARLARGRTTQP
ncbi:MAG: hypothetical protein H0V80_10630, partial [Acidobacteria bacterium]|nr:hypothetical protein [Acidobacteriota bacterium]